MADDVLQLENHVYGCSGRGRVPYSPGLSCCRGEAGQLRWDIERITELEDAAMILWAELPAEQVKFLRAEMPRLIEFLQHLHHSIEHEQAMVRVNVWAD